MGLPYFLEDRTGSNTSSEWDEIYDRMFLRAAAAATHDPKRTAGGGGGTSTSIYDMGRRSSSSRYHYRDPAIILDFAPGGALGTVLLVQQGVSMPMGHYLRKTSTFSGSLSRKFRGSDGQEYRWSCRSVREQEWSVSSAPSLSSIFSYTHPAPASQCVTADNQLVAHYDLKPVGEPAYKSSGNVLTIYEPFVHIATGALHFTRCIAPVFVY